MLSILCTVDFTRVRNKTKKNLITFLALLQLRSDLNLYNTILRLCKQFKNLFFTWESY